MGWWTRWFGRKQQRERDLDREIRAHLDLEAEEQAAAGVPRELAPYAARRAFGNVALFKEATREIWGWSSLERLSQDLRYAARILRKNPGFTTVAVLSLALGIGANTAIFSVLDAVLLRALPVRDPAQLVQLEEVHEGQAYNFFSYPAFGLLRERNQVFSDVFAWAARGMNLGMGGEVEPVEGLYVAGNYYASLGVPALLGRTLTPEDDRPAAPSVAVLSHQGWIRRFGADPGVVGRTVTIEGVPVAIVGVTPAWFFGAEVGSSWEIAVPVTLQSRLNPDRPFLGRTDAQWLRVMARLKPNVSEQQARAQLTVLWPHLLSALDPQGQYGTRSLGIRLEAASTGLSDLRIRFSKPLFVLMGIVGLVLLIACANVANLLLARARTRHREMAVRLALGASTPRLMRQLITESVFLAALGGILGLFFSFWAATALVQLLSSRIGSAVYLNVRPDWRVLVFTAAIALATGVLFGLAPAFQTTRAGLGEALRTSTRVAGTRRTLGKVLVAAQVALCLVLLIGAGLFVRSLRKLVSVDTGFQREGVLLGSLHPARAGYRDTALANFYRQLLERVSALPGVSSASLSVYPPLTGGGGTFFGAAGVLVDGRRAPQNTQGYVYLNIVSPHFFETLRTPLVAGRDFGPQDHERAPRVAIVSEALVRHYFPDGSPLGRHIQIDSGPADEIVGVVKNAKYETLREKPHFVVYQPYLQNLSEASSVNLEVRGAGSLAGLAPAVRLQVRAIAPQVPVAIFTLTDWVDQFLTQERLIAVLASTFGLLALTLAAVGLYGVAAYAVTQRTGEIGIRMALGAQAKTVLWLALREGLLLVLAGIAVGIPTALGAARMISSMLFGLTTNDPLTLAMAIAVLIAVATVAIWIPARRASRIDPITALRYE
ncbi:MAG TPA: ABC transporter permease [Bryobacteraceae bacterium]|nr:ABC transporter permease [Bryobacteraceae bacterium]